MSKLTFGLRSGDVILVCPITWEAAQQATLLEPPEHVWHPGREETPARKAVLENMSALEA